MVGCSHGRSEAQKVITPRSARTAPSNFHSEFGHKRVVGFCLYIDSRVSSDTKQAINLRQAISLI